MRRAAASWPIRAASRPASPACAKPGRRPSPASRSPTTRGRVRRSPGRSRPMPDAALPDGLVLAFYGDDFTGSSAVLEVLTFAGLPTVLFLDVPTPERLARFADCRAAGIAGVARSQ